MLLLAAVLLAVDLAWAPAAVVAQTVTDAERECACCFLCPPSPPDFVVFKILGACAPMAAAGALLLSIRNSTSNWDEFAAANNITGWVSDRSIPVCVWTGISCNENGALQSV